MVGLIIGLIVGASAVVLWGIYEIRKVFDQWEQDNEL